jgi:hypothetical protein
MHFERPAFSCTVVVLLVVWPRWRGDGCRDSTVSRCCSVAVWALAARIPSALRALIIASHFLSCGSAVVVARCTRRAHPQRRALLSPVLLLVEVLLPPPLLPAVLLLLLVSCHANWSLPWVASAMTPRMKLGPQLDRLRLDTSVGGGGSASGSPSLLLTPSAAAYSASRAGRPPATPRGNALAKSKTVGWRYVSVSVVVSVAVSVAVSVSSRLGLCGALSLSLHLCPCARVHGCINRAACVGAVCLSLQSVSCTARVRSTWRRKAC